MFWRFGGGFANISSLDSVLDKPDLSVEELLDEADLIQELKQQNSKLVEFLRNEPVLKKLLEYVTADKPAEDAESVTKEEEKTEEEKTTSGLSFFGKGKDRSRSKSLPKGAASGDTEQEKKEAQRKKYAYVSCEVLSSEVWSIAEAIVEHRNYLHEFWQYLYRPAPLDPLQAGYFTKVNEALLDKKTEDMLAFLKTLDGVVPAMVKHVDCPMIMDLLLKIISLEKHEGGQGVVDWLQSQDLIPLLLSYVSPQHNSATQTSAGDFLKAIITISANATTADQSVIGPNELTRQLVSETCIKSLINDMLHGGNTLTVGVGIIIEVIRKNNSDYDLDNQPGPEPKTSDPIYLGTLLRQFAHHIPDFMSLIRSKSARKPDLKAAFGRNIEPLGFDRFKTCELMAELLHCSNMALLNEQGAEQEVRKRDAKRELLKAEGKLEALRAPPSPSQRNGHDEFGSSVDSHGFHHAARPSDDEMNEKPEETRRLEVQNASDEDGFEKVNAPSADDFPDEVTFDDMNEKTEDKTPGTLPKLGTLFPDQSGDLPLPLSPNKKALPHFDPPPTAAADSPTTASVTDRIHNLGVDEDVVMREFGEGQIDHADDGLSELEKEALARPEDKPAPLFAKADSAPEADLDPSQDIDASVATLQGHDATVYTGERTAFESELDGTPVVGDLLKMRFVEHQVVPTILDFFFRFPWNNFLHNVVYDVVQQVFNGTLDRGYNRTLAFDLFTPVQPGDGQSAESIGLLSGKDVTDRILDGQSASDASQADKGMRLGYMGHLTLIAEEVCKFGNRHPPESLDQLVLDRVHREAWQQYVEGVLAETREKDNAVLGGVRPENAIGMRNSGGGSSGFGPNTANTLANAGITPADSLAMSEGTVGQSFEINSGTMLGNFADDDDEMDDEADRRGLSDDEQASPESAKDGLAIPAPLNIPPSRARRTLAARLAQKHQSVDSDSDAADTAALDVAGSLPEDGLSEIDSGLAPEGEIESGLQITGLRSLRGVSKFSGLFSSSDDSSSSGDSSDIDEDQAGRDETLNRAEGDYEDAEGGVRRGFGGKGKRRPSTTEAKARTPLDDDEEEDAVLRREMERKLVIAVGDGEGTSPFADPDDSDSSDDDDMVEIPPRRVG